MFSSSGQVWWEGPRLVLGRISAVEWVDPLCGLESSVTTGRGFFSSGAVEKRRAHWAVTAVAEEQAAAAVVAAAARLFFSSRPSWFFFFFLRRNQTLVEIPSPPPLLSLAHPSHVAARVLDGWLLRNASCTPAGFQLSFSFLLSPTLFFCAHTLLLLQGGMNLDRLAEAVRAPPPRDVAPAFHLPRTSNSSRETLENSSSESSDTDLAGTRGRVLLATRLLLLSAITVYFTKTERAR